MMTLVWLPLFLLIIVAVGLSVAMLVLALLGGRRLAAGFVAAVGVLFAVLMVIRSTSLRHRHGTIMHLSSAPHYAIEAWPHDRIEPPQVGQPWSAPTVSSDSAAPLARSTYAAGVPIPPAVAPLSLPPVPPAAFPVGDSIDAGNPTGESSTAAATSANRQDSTDASSESIVDESTESLPQKDDSHTTSDDPANELRDPADVVEVDQEEEPSDADVPVAAADTVQDADAVAGENVVAADDAAVQEAAAAEAVAAVADAENSVPAATGTDALSPVPLADPAAAATSVPSIAAPAHDVNADAVIDSNPSPAPAWVQQPPERIDGHWAEVLVSDPFEVPYACDEDLQRRTRAKIVEFAEWRARQLDLSPHVRLPLRIGHEEVEMVVRERHYQRRATSMGEMYQGYQLTVMDDAFQARLDQLIADALVADRLAATGAVSGVVLGGVALLFGVFRFAARKSPDPLSVS